MRFIIFLPQIIFCKNICIGARTFYKHNRTPQTLRAGSSLSKEEQW